jgi:hypothetical protein
MLFANACLVLREQLKANSELRLTDCWPKECQEVQTTQARHGVSILSPALVLFANVLTSVNFLVDFSSNIVLAVLLHFA